MKRIKRILGILAIIFILQVTLLVINTQAAEKQTIIFTDNNTYLKVVDDIKNRYSITMEQDDTNKSITISQTDIERVEKIDLNNSNITNISGIEKFYNLRDLSISNNKITDISCLSQMKKLETLMAYGNTISDISPLSELVNLKYLSIAKNKLTEENNVNNALRNLSSLTNLKELDASHNYIKYINGLENLNKLEKLNLYNNAICDITNIGFLSNLKELKLGQNNEKTEQNIVGIDELNELTNLKVLEFSQNNISNILDNISNLTNLETLQVEENQISNIELLANLTNLKKINLYNNKVRDISPLSQLSNLEEIIIGKNDIRDLTSILDNNQNIIWENIKKIDLSNNKFLYTLYSSEITDNNTIRIDNNRRIIEKIKDKVIELNYEYLTDTSKLPHIDNNGVRYVTYDDFGAKCDGIYDDFIAIRNAHIFANNNNCEVRGVEGKTYHIFKYFEGSVAVRTNVDWKNANFIIHDEEIEELSGRNKSLFIARNFVDSKTITSPTWTINTNTKKIENITQELEELNSKGYSQYLCIVVNENKKQYIRYGRNASSGNVQRDYFVIDKSGNVMNNIQWDFEQITSFTIYAIPNEKMHIKNGNFTSNNLLSKSETNDCFRNLKEYYYERNIYFNNIANATIENINHTVPNDNMSGSYRGFVKIANFANIKLKDCNLYSRKFCRSGRSTYGLYLSTGVNLLCENIVSNDINESDRWGIVCSLYCRDVKFNQCTLNRIDSHMGMYNLTVENCNIGYWGLRLIGQGDINVIDSQVTSPQFISLREDYGSTWNGNVNIINSKYKYVGTAAPRMFSIGVSLDDDGSLHDFGYECKFPNVNIENLTIDNENDNKYNYVWIIPNSTSGCEKLLDSYWPENIYINGYKFENNLLENPYIKYKAGNYGNINTNFVVTNCKLNIGDDVYFEISPNSSALNKISIYKDDMQIITNKVIDKMYNYTFKESGNYKIEIKSYENVNNEEGTNIYEFNIEEPEIFESDIYEIEEYKIKNIQPNTNYADFIKNINTNMEYIIKEGEKDVTGTDRIKTGQVLTVGDNTYTLVITGDTNGDGKADIKDILKINKHRLNKTQLTNCYYEAGDVNKDGKVDIRDILRVNRYRLGKISEL